MIHQGDALEVLRKMPAESVQCCVTSPPYYGLRDYGIPSQIGLEESPAAYVEKLVSVFAEVRRVLRSDGVCWLNLGDSYANDWKWGGATGGKHAAGLHGTQVGRAKRRTGFKAKELIGIPWLVAFALRADDWYLRQGVVWAKPNAMPESVRDRCTTAHEFVFLLTKQPRYYFDADAVSEPCAEKRYRGSSFTRGKTASMRHGLSPVGTGPRVERERRNIRSVWTIPTRSFPGAHFAVMPEALVERCVLAGSRAGDLILDPFAGAGTVGVVSERHDRLFEGIELNPAYVEMANRRIGNKETP